MMRSLKGGLVLGGGGRLLDCLHKQGHLDHTSEGLKSKLKQVIKLGKCWPVLRSGERRSHCFLEEADSTESRIRVMVLMDIA